VFANTPLLEAQPAVVVCPTCTRRLMEIKDVQWALTRLEFTYECTGCGAEHHEAIGAEAPVFGSRASALLHNLEIFSFDRPRFERGRSTDLRTLETGLRRAS